MRHKEVIMYLRNLIVWLSLGFIIAVISWRVWRRGKSDSLSFVCFPFSTLFQRVGHAALYASSPPIAYIDDRVSGWIAYVFFVSMFWPCKVLITIVGLFCRFFAESKM
jgi:4-amino-4-deoxy-L-arabinose transferase-like glycosyltransferase